MDITRFLKGLGFGAACITVVLAVSSGIAFAGHSFGPLGATAVVLLIGWAVFSLAYWTGET